MGNVSSERDHKSVHGVFLCRIARLVSILVCFVTACGLIRWGASEWPAMVSGDYILSILYLGFVPAIILFVVIAWRSHLLGGLSMLLLSYALLPTAFLVGSEENLDVGLFVFAALVLPVGAVLHLVVWLKERRVSRSAL